MKAKDLRQKTDGELREEFKNLREAIFNKRFQSEIEQAPNPGVKRMRREIATILTVLRERGLRTEG